MWRAALAAAACNVMKARLPCIVLLAILTARSVAAAPEPVIIDFEQFPLTNNSDCPVFPYDRGAGFAGGAIRQNESDSINPTKALRASQPVFGFNFCSYNPGTISFDEPTSEVSFDLYTSNRFITVSDDRGWSRSIDFHLEFEEWGNSNRKVRVMIPSTGIRQVTVHDPCDYFSAGCGPWNYGIDNVSFIPERPCISINGPSTVDPNTARSPTSGYVPVVITVDDCAGNALDGIAVEIFLTVDQTSGGHSGHHPLVVPRPVGGLREDLVTASGPGAELVTFSTDPNGQILLQFVPPQVSGKHAIDAKCVDTKCYAPDPPLSVDVMVDGLAPIPPSNVFYTLVEYLPNTIIGKNIGDNGKHDGENHYLTPEASDILWRVAFNYAALLNFQPTPEKLHVNDASLPMGGLFDISGQWTPNHRGHRKGTVVDVRANQSPGAVPASYDRYFQRAASRLGAVAVREYAGQAPPNPNEHYHLRLRGVDE